MKLSILRVISSLINIIVPSTLTYWILGGQFWYIFPPLVGGLSFLFFEYLSNENSRCLKFSFSLKQSSFSIVYVALYLISIVSIWLIPSSSQSSIFINWSTLSSIQWIRTFLALGLASLFPGYVIVAFVKNRLGTVLPLSAVILFSFLLSILFGGTIAVISVSLGVFSNVFLNSLIITLANSALLLLFCFHELKEKNMQPATITKEYSLLELSLITLIIFFVLVTTIVANLQHFPMLSGDQWRHNGVVSIMLDGQVPTYPGKLYPQISYPFFFYASSFYNFSLIGLASANSYALLNLFDPIIVLGVYYACKSYSSNSKVGISAALFSLTAGLGWVLFKLSPSYSIASWDMFVYPTYAIYWWATPIGLYALPSILGAIGLLGSAKYKSKSKLLLLSLLLTVGYLMHILEIAVFIVAVGVIILIHEKLTNISIRELWFVSLSLILYVIILELLSPVKSYVFATKFSTISPVIIAVGTMPSVFLLLKSFTNGLRSLLKRTSSFLLANEQKLVMIIVLSYTFLCIAWLVAFSGKLDSMNQDFRTYTTPWYAWPIRLGVPGLLALLSLSFRGTNAKKYRLFFFTFSMLPILIGLGSRILPTFSSIGNILYSELTWIGVCALAGFAIVYLIGNTVRKHNLIVPFFISIILFSGFASTLITVQQHANAENLSSTQLEALQFLKANKAPDSSVLTFTATSAELISCFADVLNGKQTIPSAISPLLQAKSPEPALKILNQSNVQFLYLTEDDFSLLNQEPDDQSFVNWLVQNLPIAFENEEVTILSMPSVSFPTRNGSTLLLVPTQTTGMLDSYRDTYYRLVLGLGMSQLSFDVRQSYDLSDLSEKSSAILSYDAIVQNSSSVDIYKGESTSYWQNNAGLAAISISSQDSSTDSGLMLNFSESAGPEKLSRVIYTPNTTLDLSHYDSLSLSLKPSYNSTIDVNIKDEAGSWRRWLVPAQGGKWSDLSLKMNDYTSSYGSINIDKISGIIVGYYNATVPSILEISQIRATGNPFVLSPAKSAALIDFVSNGGHLVIMSSSRSYFGMLEETLGFSVKKEEIDIPETALHPFFIETSEIGQGSINYVNDDGIFSEIAQFGRNQRSTAMQSFFSLIDNGQSRSNISSPDVPPYWGQTTGLFATGQVELSSDCLIPLDEKMQCKTANFTASQANLDNQNSDDSVLRNATVYMPDIINTTSKIVATACDVKTDGIGQYSIVNFQNAKWILTISPGSSIPVTAEVEGEEVNFVITGGLIELELESSEFVSGPFRIHVNGDLNLSKAYFAWPPQNFEAAGGNLSIDGSSEVWVENGDGILLAPEINIDQNATVSRQSTSILLASENFSLEEIQLIIVLFLVVSSILLFLSKRNWLLQEQ